VESGAVGLPSETGSIRWPSLGLKDIFFPTIPLKRNGLKGTPLANADESPGVG
jgi:hypothetical protein